jgi:hypothetical protein
MRPLLVLLVFTHIPALYRASSSVEKNTITYLLPLLLKETTISLTTNVTPPSLAYGLLNALPHAFIITHIPRVVFSSTETPAKNISYTETYTIPHPPIRLR